MRCPYCKEGLTYVEAISECRRRAEVNEQGEILSYEEPIVNEVVDAVNCPHCWRDITRYIVE